MDDLDLTEQVPRDFETGPIVTLDPIDEGWTPALVEAVAPLSPERAALGTKTGIAALPRRTITLPPPIPTAALRAKGTEAGIDIDFSGDEPATTTFLPNGTAPPKEPDPAWLAKFNPPKLADAAFLYDKPAQSVATHVDGSISISSSTSASSSAAAEFWTSSPKAEPVVTAPDEPPPWDADRASSEPLSWTAPVQKQSLEIAPSSSAIGAIVAAAEAETAAAIAASLKLSAPKAPVAVAPAAPVEEPILASIVSPKPVVEETVAPVLAAGADASSTFESEDGTTADPWAATDAASAAGLQVPRRPLTSTVALPPPMPRTRTASSAGINLQPRASSALPTVLVEDSQATAMPKLPAPSANWLRPSIQIAAATEPREPTLSPLPIPAKSWQRAASPSAVALAPTALGRPQSSSDVTASIDDDELLAAAQGSRSTLKISALIAAGGVVMAAIVYVMVRLASPSAPAAPEAVAVPVPVPVAVAAPVAPAIPAAVAAAAGTPAPAAVAAAVPAPVAVPVPAPVAVPVPAPVPAPAAIAAVVPTAPAAPAVGPLPTLIAMPIITTPPGATVTLVADGKATVLGSTPLTASLDPSKAYDLVLASPNQTTRMQHVAPGTREVRIDFGAPAAANHAIAETAPSEHHATPAPTKSPAPAPAAKPAPIAAKPAPAPVAKPAIATTPAAKPAPTPAPTPKPVATAPAPTAAKPAAVAVAGPTGTGVLMVSSKPPCDIWIDGKPTHLVTPQKKLTLSAGPHTITLLNATQHLNSQTKIEILVGLPSRLIKDFTTK